MRRISRREFIQTTALGLGALSVLDRLPGAAMAFDPADVLLHNGNIITVDARDTVVQAVALKKGIIVKVGSNEEARAWAGSGTEIIDLQGKTVTPGLVDAHLHVMGYGMQFRPQFLNVRFPLTPTKAALIKLVADRAKTIKPGEWIVGNQGFVLTLEQTPTRWELDEVAPQNPVLLRHNSGQHSTANSLALKLAGITANTPNPYSGKIGRKAGTMEPNGLLFHYPAENLVNRVAPGFSDRDNVGLVEDVERGQLRCLAAGYTSGHDVIVAPQKIAGYYAAAKENRLKMRIRLMEYVSNEKEAEQLLHKREVSKNPLLATGGYKLAVDGGIAAKTVLMHDTSLEMAKLSYVYHDQAVLNRMTRLFHAAGHQVAFHATGDKAIDMAINAIEDALQAVPRENHRHRIEHCLFPTEKALERIKQLGIVVSVSPQWIRFHSDIYKAMTDEKTMQRLLPLKTMLEMGIPVAFGCDVPATILLEPKWAFIGAVGRTTNSRYTPNPAEQLTISQALRMHTMGAAYAGFEEKVKGSLEEGKVADMVVWSHDLLSMPLAEMQALAPERVMVDGKFV